MNRVKQCASCGTDFAKPGTYSWAQWETALYCSNECRARELVLGPQPYFDRFQGRWMVRLRGGRACNWSRVVAEDMQGGAPLAPGAVVHHLNEDKADDRPQNLRVYASHSEHMAAHHSRRPGFGDMPREVRQQWTNKLTPERVRAARAAHAASGLPAKTFARQAAAGFGVSPSALTKALHGVTWGNVI